MSTERLAAAGFTPEPTLACVTWTRAMPDGSTIVLTGADERDDPTDDLTGACWVTHLADPSDWATERASLRAPTLDAALDWTYGRFALPGRARAVIARLTVAQRDAIEGCHTRPHGELRTTLGRTLASLERRGCCVGYAATDLGREVARLLAEGTDR